MESILLLANVSVEIIVWRRLLLAKNGVLLYYSPTDYALKRNSGEFRSFDIQCE